MDKIDKQDEVRIAARESLCGQDIQLSRRVLEGYIAGFAAGDAWATERIAWTMLESGLGMDQVTHCTGLPAQRVMDMIDFLAAWP